MAAVNAPLRLHLINDANIASLVGARVFPIGEEIGVEVYPIITFQKVSARHVRHLTAGSGITERRIQINNFARDSATVETLAGYVRDRLHTTTGIIGSGGNVLTVRSCTLDDEDDEPEKLGDGSEDALFWLRQDYILWHVDSIP